MYAVFYKVSVDNPQGIGIVGWEMFSIYHPTGYFLCYVLGDHDSDTLLEFLNTQPGRI